ncbi:MAG: sigma 54-interacting transcriptional regulator [Pseudomonadota bacterium]
MLPVNLHAIIETHEQPFVVIDQDYRIVAANGAYCRQHGRERQDVLHRHCYEVSHHSPRPCHESGELCPHLALFRDGQSGEVLHIHYDGHGHACRARIRGHALRGLDGRLYLGEMLVSLDAERSLGCEDMRMVGQSPVFLACMDNLARAADSEASVLLRGESGVGKELAARFLHDRSRRTGGAFLPINCAAVPEAMFESELFGHEKGAFTGSTGRKQGLYELAHGGTLFLDEVAEIPLAQQAKLLRVLETGEFRRVGGTATLRANVRLVCATNRNLLDWVEQGRFREDLYYRVAGIEVNLPPLRERREDIQPLAEALLVRLSSPGRPPCRLDKGAQQKLRNYAFPGNVRELRNLLQRAMLRCQEGAIRAEDIVFQQDVPPALSPGTRAGAGNLKGAEREHIARLLARHGGHRRTVADLLGISERTLYRKLGNLGLK